MFACPTSSIRSLMFTVLIVMFTCLVQPPCVVAQGSVIYHLPTFFDANRTDCDTLHRRAVVALVGHDYARAKLLLVAGELPLRVASGNGEKVGGCLYTLGLCLKFEGNYAKAAEIFVAARHLNPDDLAIYNALGQCYAELGDYAQAIRYFRLRMRKATLQHLPQKCAEACIDLSATLNKTPKADAAAAVARFGIAQTNDAATKAALQLNLGNACLYLARYDEALAAYRATIDGLTHHPNDSATLALAYLNAGIIEKRQKHALQAFAAMRRAADILTVQHDTTGLASTYDNLADVYILSHDYPHALEYYKKAVVLNATSSGNLPDRFIYLGDKAACLAEMHDYAAALAAYRATDAVVDSITRRQLTTNNSKLMWREKVRRIYTGALATCYATHNTAAAWGFFEKSRAMLLLENIAKHQHQNATHHTATTAELRSRLFPHPAYSVFDRSSETSAAFVSYFVADTVLYSFVVTESSEYFQSSRFPRADVVAFLANISNANPSNGVSVDSLALKLYGVLLAELPLGLPSSSGTLRLTISPDDVLTALPFEALRPSAGSWLLERASVGYTYSASTLLAYAPQPLLRAPRMVGFAPVHFAGYGLPTLSFTAGGLERFATEYGAKNYTEAAANATNFWSAAPHADILNVYSHAAAAATPLLYLSDTILLLNALATQTFRARLVALVACETARGKLEAGEGVMSWARGFAAAGVPSVLANLWSVDERATVTIYAAFYRFLYEGYPKDVALQRAKLEYLHTHAAATPFYWAAAALIGNSDAVVVPRTPALYYWVYIAFGLAVFVAAGAGFFIRRRRVGMKRVGISSERLTFTLSLATFV